MVGISRMEVIAHARTSSNDRRSHRYDTGISSEYVIDFYCPFGPPPLILSLAYDTILIISQEALFCYPHRFRLLHSPQHSWGIRLFIYPRYLESLLLHVQEGNNNLPGCYTPDYNPKTLVSRLWQFIGLPVTDFSGFASISHLTHVIASPACRLALVSAFSQHY